MSYKIINPKSSETWVPLVAISWSWKFGFFLQTDQPFGLLIRIPCLMLRWGSA